MLAKELLWSNSLASNKQMRNMRDEYMYETKCFLYDGIENRQIKWKFACFHPNDTTTEVLMTPNSLETTRKRKEKGRERGKKRTPNTHNFYIAYSRHTDSDASIERYRFQKSGLMLAWHGLKWPRDPEKAPRHSKFGRFSPSGNISLQQNYILKKTIGN